MPKVTVEIEVTEEDLQAAHLAFLTKEGEFTPEELAHCLRETLVMKMEEWQKALQATKDWKLMEERFPEASLDRGYWDCEDSPTGNCWYDLKSPMGDDECLFCHGPDERK
jgi:hypothetical protein